MTNETEIRSLFCRLDSPRAMQEYGDAICIRYIGVKPNQFSQRQFEEGITAYAIDVPLQDHSMHGCHGVDDCPLCFKIRDEWLEIRYVADPQGSSHIYPCFGEGEPSNIKIVDIDVVPGVPLPSFPSYQPISPNEPTTWTCSAFEVGQGMASIIYCDTYAYLLDAGAGTPIKRGAYQNGSLQTYDLRELAAERDLVFILSHGDSDHWRMLGWDSGLAGRIQTFVVPSNMRQIAFFDVTVKARVRQCGSHLQGIQLGPTAKLDVYRTSPQEPTSNNDGLVAVFTSGDVRALISGDCVYRNLAHDNDGLVRNLVDLDYAAVIVPHHGDFLSARDVPPATSHDGLAPIAFFSAGNHRGYGHPTQESVESHEVRGYTAYIQRHPTGIVEVRLI